MSGIRSVSLLVQWGGHIKYDDVESGLDYEGGFHKCVRVKISTTYVELLNKISQVTGMNRMTHNITLICRFPTFIGQCMKFFPLEVNDNDAVSTIIYTVIENLSFPMITLYVIGNPNVQNVENNVMCLDNTLDESQHHNSPHTTHVNFSGQTPNQVLTHDSTRVNPANDVDMFVGCEESRWVSEGMNPDNCDNCTDLSEEADDVNGDDDIINEIDNDVELGNNDEAEPSNFNASNFRLHEPMIPSFRIVEDIEIPFDGITSATQFSTQWDPLVDELYKGLLFKDKTSMKYAVRQYSLKRKKEFITMTNNSSTCWEVMCKLHSETGCLWRLRGSKQKCHNLFEIVTYRGPHSCTRRAIAQDHHQLSSQLIGNDLVGMIRSEPSMTVKLIITTIKNQYGYEISYYKAWKGKQKAIATIFGDWDESYKKLPKLASAIKRYNPGSVFIIHSVQNNNNNDEVIFVRMFWAFKPSIEGFTHCRPFISIDATHLYGKYKGKLLIAMGLDGNSQLFPIAFGIVKEESADDWGWFLRLLRLQVVGPDRGGICLVSDRHKGIISAVNNEHNGWTEPLAVHRFCLRHLRSNFHDRFKSRQLYDLVTKAGKERQVRKFNIIMNEIKEISESAHRYLMRTPVNKWALAHDGGYRFGNTTTNISECFNGVLKAARSLPISALVQLTYYRLVHYAEMRREYGRDALIQGRLHCPNIYEMVKRNEVKAGYHNLRRFNAEIGIGEVITRKGNRHAVNLQDKYCSCGKWTIYRIPCSHAICMINSLSVDYTQYISDWYTTQKYFDTWNPDYYPLHHEDYWEEPVGRTLVPDQHLRRAKGRPKSTRFHNEMDISDSRRNNLCGLCRQPGHDRRQCHARPGVSSSRNLN